MEAQELIKKVRTIEIRTRGLSKQLFSGEYHSAFKGRGMAFSEVRDYVPEDDFRDIDWNVTARFDRPFVKVFEEERELTLMLIVDVSGSESFGATERFKKDLITELCAVLAFSSLQNNDKVGLIFFSDRIEKFIPPKKGRKHVLRIIRELLDFKPVSKKTDISSALRYFVNVTKKRSIAFVLSDFMDEGFEDALAICGRKHDTIAVNVSDVRERDIPPVGLIRAKDAETGEVFWIDTSKRSFAENHKKLYDEKVRNLEKTFARHGVDSIRIRTDESYIAPLMQFFKSRGGR